MIHKWGPNQNEKLPRKNEEVITLNKFGVRPNKS